MVQLWAKVSPSSSSDSVSSPIDNSTINDNRFPSNLNMSSRDNLKPTRDVDKDDIDVDVGFSFCLVLIIQGELSSFLLKQNIFINKPKL